MKITNHHQTSQLLEVKEKTASQYHANVEHRLKAIMRIIIIFLLFSFPPASFSLSFFLSSFPLLSSTFPKHTQIQAVLIGTLCPGYKKHNTALAFSSWIPSVRKHLHYQRYFCGKDSFSLAVFKEHLCSEPLSFTYGSCNKYSKTKERKNPSRVLQNWVLQTFLVQWGAGLLLNAAL